MAGENALVFNPQGGASLEIASGGAINVASGGSINLASGASLNMAAGSILEQGADIDVASGSSIDVESGGQIDLESGALLNIQSGAGLAVNGSAGIAIGAAGTMTIANGGQVLDASGAILRFADVTLTPAQVAALNGSPIALVAAPGASSALVFEGALITMDYNSSAYSGVAAGEDLTIRYTDGSGLEVGTMETTGFLNATSDQMRWVRPHTAASGVSSITPVANAALVAHMLTGDVVAGDSNVKIRTFYRVVPILL